MREYGKLVAVRYLDGRVVKGRTADFQPTKPEFHVLTEDDPRPVLIRLQELKAIFFVKTLGGNPQYNDRKEFGSRQGIEKEVWIKFADGEQLAGWSATVTAAREGFYMVPTDSHSNIIRAFVFRAATTDVIVGPEAVEAAKAFQKEHGPASSVADDWDGFL